MKAIAFGVVAILAAQPDAPTIPGLKITTRRMSGPAVWTDTVYFKGARQRRDSTFEMHGRAEARHVSTILVDCRGRRRIMLNHDARTYASISIETLGERIARLERAGLKNLPPATGPEVTTTFDAVDTGERRQHGRYTARHVVTTMTTDAAPGASVQSGVRKQDGWYLDLPDSNCSSDASAFSLLRGSGYVVKAGQRPPRDRERIVYLGRARRGFAIEETDSEMKTELIDLSEPPLDDALFAIPGDYRPALAAPYGGYDMSKPDTFANHAALYCELFARWVHSFFE